MIVFLLQDMQAFLAPLAFGLLLFYALDPAVDAMERMRVPRWIAAALALGLTIGTILGGAYALQDEAMTVINELPAGARRVATLVERRPRTDPGPLDKVEQAADGACEDRQAETAAWRRARAGGRAQNHGRPVSCGPDRSARSARSTS